MGVGVLPNGEFLVRISNATRSILDILSGSTVTIKGSHGIEIPLDVVALEPIPEMPYADACNVRLRPKEV